MLQEMRKLMNDIYETGISDTRWWLYDIPGNIGWIAYLICLVRCLIQRIDLFSLAAIIAGLLMLVGVAELISERVAKRDRVLPRRRVLRGFGALTLGGIVGAVISVIGIIAKIHGRLPVWMTAGSILCAIFAGLLYKGYRKQEKE